MVTSGGGGATGLWWVDPRDATMHRVSYMQRTVSSPTEKSYLAQNVSSTEVEKLFYSK